MSFKLVIAEKPSVSKAISAVLGAGRRGDGFFDGNGYIVSWCFGHLAELASADAYDAKYANWHIEDIPILPEQWQYRISMDKSSQFKVLKGLMHRDDVTEVINACDAGREGELIFRTVYLLAGCDKPMKRLWISSMEDEAIRRGFSELRDGKDYDSLYASALCRSKADWLVGINATRLFSLLYHRTLNVGRVMSPTLALLVQREAEIAGFVPEPFYTVTMDFGDFTAESERFKAQIDAVIVTDACRGKPAVVKSVIRKEKSEKAPLLYDLTTLQRDANRLLGYTAQQTLDYTQTLYEKKLCTYPRTDSRFLTDDMVSGVESLVLISAPICGVDAPNSVQSAQVCDSSKVSDHHAIVPTPSAGKADLSALPLGEREIMRLISRRILCAVCPQFRYAETKTVLECSGVMFEAAGKTVLELGWRAYAEQEQKNNGLPELYEGQMLTQKEISMKEGKSTPPKHFTEDTLLSAMEVAGAKEMPDDAERKGLGTPATRAGVLEKLVSTGFVERRKNKKSTSLIPAQTGVSLITVLPEQLQSPFLTAEWEHKLKEIERGELEPDAFMAEISDMVLELTQSCKPVPNAEVLFPSGREVIGKCPRCGGDVTESKKGYFCESRECKFGMWRDNKFFTAKKATLTKKIAASLLKDGRVKLTGLYSEKTGKSYTATVVLDDDGKRVGYRLEFSKHTYEYTVREDILMTLEVNDISDAQASALLKSPAPLGDIFEEFEDRETSYMDTVRDCIESRANAVIEVEKEQRKILLSTPVYKYPASYARENNELEIYRASHKANIACRDAIENTIRDDYRDNCLGADSAKQVIAEFGYDRTLYVLANTVREKEWDGRIDHKNKDWARTVTIFEDDNAFGDNRNREFVVGQSHPGLLNLFVNQARYEFLLSQPLTKEDIQAEAARILGKLQDAHEPNSPNGTHFIAEVSKDFMLRANSKDTDKLFALLPFQSLSLSTLNDRKGVYAIISKDENRSQPLQKRKPSVRNKLQKAASTTKPPATAKSKDMEL